MYSNKKKRGTNLNFFLANQRSTNNQGNTHHAPIGNNSQANVSRNNNVGQNVNNANNRPNGPTGNSSTVRNNFGNNSGPPGNDFGNSSSSSRNDFGNTSVLPRNNFGNNSDSFRNKFGSNSDLSRNNFGNNLDSSRNNSAQPRGNFGGANFGNNPSTPSNSLGNMPGPSRNNFGNRNSTGNDNPADTDIVCACNQEARQFTVRKEGPNQGKQYYHIYYNVNRLFTYLINISIVCLLFATVTFWGFTATGCKNFYTDLQIITKEIYHLTRLIAILKYTIIYSE